MAFPAPHRGKLHSINPLERLNGETKRRSDVVGILPDEAAVTRLIGLGQVPFGEVPDRSLMPARALPG